MRPATPSVHRRFWRRLRLLRDWGSVVGSSALGGVGFYLGRALGRLESEMAAPTRFACRPPRSAALLCVYRHENAATVVELVEQARQRDMRVALWALDRPVPALAAHTVGCGPGQRVDLLNRLWRTLPSGDFHQVVVADDDFWFSRGSLDRLLDAAEACGFGICQPAHDWRSRQSYPFTRRRWFLLARATTFVEPGPVFVVSGPWIERVLPFPEDFGMGWGLWVEWLTLMRQGCRLGIVDCVAINHPSPVGHDYAPTRRVEWRRLRSLLQKHDFERPRDAQRVLGLWKAGQPEPPWARSVA